MGSVTRSGPQVHNNFDPYELEELVNDYGDTLRHKVRHEFGKNRSKKKKAKGRSKGRTDG